MNKPTSKRDITPAEVYKQLALGAQQKSYATRSALQELAAVTSIDDLLRSQNAWKAGKW